MHTTPRFFDIFFDLIEPLLWGFFLFALVGHGVDMWKSARGNGKLALANVVLTFALHSFWLFFGWKTMQET